MCSISEISFFAHGTAFDSGGIENPGHVGDYAVTLGYSAVGGVAHNNQLNIFISDLVNLNGAAFAVDNYSYFGSCRTGNKFNGKIFAQEWANITNGRVEAAFGAYGRTSYDNIYPDNRSLRIKIKNKISSFLGINYYIAASRESAREEYGFSKTGSINYPRSTAFTSFKIFRPR